MTMTEKQNTCPLLKMEDQSVKKKLTKKGCKYFFFPRS